ncbi:uncharacterized protein LOC132564915 [Ylistrum balloti]|uniref:uncharacterized protein LOC132564915 n=1 Tax=Ylistrum balloti TaxID=509963 RepID=UPI002905B654|nr:uncharacterized protein LOC132564915 [Ylistrum balloti]
MLWTLMTFSLLCAACDIVQGWIVAPSAFTVFRTKYSWNEARQICENNNNTLLTIPDEQYWAFWKFVLNPESEALHREMGNSRYWFGLHAPDSTNLSSLMWADCVVPSWIEWTNAGRNYVPEQPCLAFDVYFKPFTTILLKIWLADSCSTTNYFVCSEPLTVRNDTCIAHGCDEHVHLVKDNTECVSMCSADTNCRTNFTFISGLGICHVFFLSPYRSNSFYRICLLVEDTSVDICSDSNGFGDIGNIINTGPDPGGYCLARESTSVPSISSDTTSTPESTTPVVMPTTEVSRTTVTTSQQMCVCSCNTANQPELTIEEKVEQLKRELTVNKKNTSLHKRKFISASDDRISATGIGSFGVGMLVIVLLSICVMDLGTLKADLQNMYRNIRSRCCRKKEETRVRHVRHVDPSITKAKLFTEPDCTVIVNSATSPVLKITKEDLSSQKNDRTTLSVPTNIGNAKTQRLLSPACTGSVSSRSSSKRSGTDRSSPGYQSSLSIQSSNASGNVSTMASRKSSAGCSGTSSLNDNGKPCGGGTQLSKLSSGDFDGDILPNRVRSTSLQSRNRNQRYNNKEPIWLRMV